MGEKLDINSETGRTIGIDLGTTNSAAAIREGNERPRVLPNSQREEQTASVVSAHNRTNEILVGSRAKRNGPLNPLNTIFSIKRLMGKEFGDSDAKTIIGKVPYQIVPADEGTGVRVIFSGKKHSPIEISAMILKKIREDAETRLGERVTHAVVTVPAYFTDAQKEATRQAGLAAGLRVKLIIDEPTAAALAFGIGITDDEENGKVIAVFDLGGGTFDISILSMGGGIFNVMNVEGNNWLGGDDFDNKIIEYVLQQVQREHSTDGSKDPSFMSDLKDAAEKAKIELSEVSLSVINFRTDLRDPEGNLIDVNVDIAREQFEGWISPFIIGPLMVDGIDKAAIPLTKKAISESNFTMDEIDHVLLVGGSTAIPLVKKELAAIFGKVKIVESVNPMNVVAEGAAVIGSLYTGIQCPKCSKRNPENAVKCENESCGASLAEGIFVPGEDEDDEGRFVDFVDIVKMTYGIAVKGGGFEKILEKGKPYGESVVRTFYTTEPNQSRLYIPVYQAEEPAKPLAKDNRLQAVIRIDLSERFHTGLDLNTPVDVKMETNQNGILSINVECKEESIGSTILRDTTIPEDEVDLEARMRVFLLLARILLQYRFLLKEPMITRIEKIVADGETAVNANDKFLGKSFIEAWGNIEREMQDASLLAYPLMWAEAYANYSYAGDPMKRSELSARVRSFRDAVDGREYNKANSLIDGVLSALSEFEKTIDLDKGRLRSL